MLGVGLVAIALVTVLVLALRAPALPVAGVGVAAVLLRSRGGGTHGTAARDAVEILGVPVLAGLFGLAVALGTLGRSWSGPATLLSHLDAWGTAAVAALISVLVNNLPPPHSWRPGNRPIPSHSSSASTWGRTCS